MEEELQAKEEGEMEEEFLSPPPLPPLLIPTLIPHFLPPFLELPLPPLVSSNVDSLLPLERFNQLIMNTCRCCVDLHPASPETLATFTGRSKNCDRHCIS
eukprot:TRINITY_DN6975_c0_g1_i8.p2 TRINITY_DN6975_c0_g1~~TRINITY_DN6975_c0_g1_i8.p2  ORF type:complete len:100 (+),score=18.84 TRINITY_DN6975_c0_g1_i8:148-447(+)